MNDVVIVSAARTPVGKFMGALSDAAAHQLGASVIAEVLHRANDFPSSEVDEVILGQVLSAGQGQNPSRQAAVSAGIPYEIPAYLVNMLCGSGLRAVYSACQSLKCGDASVVVAGGQESMSSAPHLCWLRKSVKLGDSKQIDSLVCDGLTDAFGNGHMGVTAENVARQYSVSRLKQDTFACLSQNKAEKAQRSDWFANEICPVVIDKRELLKVDEFPRHGTTVDVLNGLKPAFKKDAEATVTAGNSSGINDGAAALLMMTRAESERRRLATMATVIAWHQVALDPSVMGMGPLEAITGVLKKASWSLDQVDLFEINEAFAAQSVAVCESLGLDQSKVNVCGGAIALGHPIGASGARILVTLLYQLRRLGLRRGVASACIGGGMGIAICVDVS